MGNLIDTPRVQYPKDPYGTLYLCVRNNFDDFRPVFESLPLNERFSFLYNYALSNHLFLDLEVESTKSTEEAVLMRNFGNDAFQLKDFQEALQMYTKSVAFAPPNTKELAVAFANRSAALFRLKRYEACLVDINRALNENHSELDESWKQKVLDRKRECVAKLEEYCAAELNQLVSFS